MKHLVTLNVIIALFGMVPLLGAQSQDVKIDGFLMDSKCARSDLAKMNGKFACAKTCVSIGEKTVVVANSDNHIYTIANPDSPMIRSNIGTHVTVAGKLEGDTITVSTISFSMLFHEELLGPDGKPITAQSLIFVDKDVPYRCSCADFPMQDRYVAQDFPFPIPAGTQIAGYDIREVEGSGGNRSVSICVAPQTAAQQSAIFHLKVRLDTDDWCVQAFGTGVGPETSTTAHVVLYHSYIGQPPLPEGAIPMCPTVVDVPPKKFPPPGHWTLITVTGSNTSDLNFANVTVTAASGKQATMIDAGAPHWQVVNDISKLCSDLQLTCPMKGLSIAVPWNVSVKTGAPMTATEIND